MTTLHDTPEPDPGELLVTLPRVAGEEERPRAVLVNDPPWYGEPFIARTGFSPRRWGILIGAGAGLGFATFNAIAFGGTLTALAWATFAAITPTLAAVDHKLRTLPLRLLYPTGALIAVLLGAAWAIGELPNDTFVRAAIATVAVFLITETTWLFAPIGAFGGGDVVMLTIAAPLVATYSWHMTITALALIPALTALLYITALLTVKLLRGDRTTDTLTEEDLSIAFGPFIALGVLTAALAPELIVWATGAA